MPERDDSDTETVAEVAERLMGEFGHVCPLDIVSACVLRARRDLDLLALRNHSPKLLDRLARARLADLSGQSA